MKASTEELLDLPSQFICHEDSGHSWLAVPYQLLVQLNIEKRISPSSFRNEAMTYLEEDRDAKIFLRVFTNLWYKRHNKDVPEDFLVYQYQHNSFVHQYASFYLD